MRRKVTLIIPVVLLFLQATAWAQNYPPPYIPDRYVGDTEIYTGEATAIKPNVLFMVDNSAAMAQPGSSEPYDPSRVYPANGFNANEVYVRTAATGGTINYNTYMTSVSSVTCTAAKNAFNTSGYFAGKLKKQDGSCNAPQEGNYYLGNLLNYMFAPANIRQPNTAYAAGDVVKAAAGDSFTWTCAVAGITGNTAPAWPVIPNPVPDGFWSTVTTVSDGTVTWRLSSPLIALVTTTLNQVMPSVREKIKGGLIVFGNNNSGGEIRAPIKNINTGSGNGAFNTLLSKINELAASKGLLGGNTQPVNELLYDADWYYKGLNDSTTKISSDMVSYPNPIEYYCQESFVVMITTGASHKINASVDSKIGDQNGDNTEGNVDDSAKLLYDTDHLVDSVLDPEAKKQRVKTIVIQLAISKEPNLVKAAAHGVGETLTDQQVNDLTSDELHAMGIFYYLVQSAEELIQVLGDTMLNVVLQAHTSFVAPTIPVSQQENLRSYSGNRVYMGFFRPISKKAAWHGNLKKYGIDTATGDILDATGAYATYVDQEAPFFVDDRDGAIMAQDKVNGDFRPNTRSFWSTLQCLDDVDGNTVVLTQSGDGGVVDCGGVGEKMLLRTAPRNIYTYLPGQYLPAGYTSTTDLTAPVNRFSFDNDVITPQMLSYHSAAEALVDPSLKQFVVNNPLAMRRNLLKYIEGEDVYGRNPPSYVPAVPGRRMWVMGDVLHSKPVVVGYSTFPSNEENNCSKNKTMIYVGANDGMLHAFRDCDGEEEWSFIPTNLLGTLRRVLDQYHINYADGAVEKYIFDADKDGNIEAGDRVILIFGQRRGGGMYASVATGFYYVIDVTNPQKPLFLSRFSRGNAGLDEMGETWSEPKLGKMRIGSADKIVLWIGAGYDSCNEDVRYGATQTYLGVCARISTQDGGIETSTSSDTGLPVYPQGRGVFAINLGNLDASGNLTNFSGIGTKLWKYTAAENSNMKYSVPSEMFLMDVNFDGYIDRVYAGDTGGTLWRFDVGDTATANWRGTRVFTSNPGNGGATDTGRKVFFKGDATIEINSVLVFFATGDREHPLNRAVIDRVYAFFDKNGADYTSGPRTEADLVDVTEDQPQTAASQTAVDDVLAELQTKDGWFVRLDGMDYQDIDGNPAPVSYPGEKILAPVTLAPITGEDGRVHPTVWVTTYRPSTATNADPCIPGNLGYADALHFDYKTGEAVKNFDLFNDSDACQFTPCNTRAKPPGNQGILLGRSDRRVKLGRGIPSGIVQCVSSSGRICLGVGSGGGFQNLLSDKSSGVLPLYWRQR